MPSFSRHRPFFSRNQALTLVELIVVIVILSILSTVAFIMLSGYNRSTRDAVRLSDINNIEKWLALRLANGSMLPMPDSAITITAGGYETGYQGRFDSAAARAIQMGQSPRDPLDARSYTYAINKNQTVYQLMAFMEQSELAYGIWLTDMAYASDLVDRKPKLFGKNLGIILDENNVPVQTNIDVVNYAGPGLNIYLDDTRVLRGTGVILSQANPLSNCKRIFETTNDPKDGEYVVRPSGWDGITVYCSRYFTDKNFYNYAVGWDMEWGSVTTDWVDQWGRRNAIGTTSDDRHSWSTSLRLTGGANLVSANYTYIQPGKKYRLKGFFKLAPGSTTPSYLYFGFAEYDDQFRFIENRYVNAISGTDTVLTSDVHATDVKASFACNDAIESAWRNNLVSHSTIVFETDDSGQYNDLPNRKRSWELGKWPETSEDQARYRTQLFTREGNMCTLMLDPTIGNKIGRDYPAGTKIRMHQSGGTYNYRAAANESLSFDWKEFSWEVNGISQSGVDNAYFRRWTKFVKILLLGNYYWRKEANGSYNSWQDNATLYMDDIGLEVVN